MNVFYSIVLARPFPLYWDYDTLTEIPTTTLSSGHAGETIHSFSQSSLLAGGILVNQTHASFPLEPRLLQAAQAQRYASIEGPDRTRAGVSTLQPVVTSASAFPNTVGAFAEKFHIMDQAGLLSAVDLEELLPVTTPTDAAQLHGARHGLCP